MRKLLVPSIPGPPRSRTWLDLEKLARVEVTSEDKDYPIESALLPSETPGWRAAQPGEQTIRLWFDNPQRIRWIWLESHSLDARRSSSCDGPGTGVSPIERSSGSSGILARRAPPERLRSTPSSSMASQP
jgi:hypothetical protein